MGFVLGVKESEAREPKTEEVEHPARVLCNLFIEVTVRSSRGMRSSRYVVTHPRTVQPLPCLRNTHYHVRTSAPSFLETFLYTSRGVTHTHPANCVNVTIHPHTAHTSQPKHTALIVLILLYLLTCRSSAEFRPATQTFT